MSCGIVGKCKEHSPGLHSPQAIYAIDQAQVGIARLTQVLASVNLPTRPRNFLP